MCRGIYSVGYSIDKMYNRSHLQITQQGTWRGVPDHPATLCSMLTLVLLGTRLSDILSLQRHN